ncbi:MAG: hypothetical protein IID51_02510 [Proteobacteria bacterium]|nr:hypothetical protein [Pseudomonadota bacterium]
MRLKLIAPFSAILFGLSACTYVEDGPYVNYQAQFAVGAPLYYSGGAVTWRYYDGYTYHLFDHHGRFVGYAYYDYDHFYRIADAYGNVVYYLRWSNNNWRIENNRGHHLGFIQSDNRGNHWIADTRGHRHSAMHGWGRSGSHGHAHAGRHDDRVEHREARHRYDAERDRWRNRRHDEEIRQRQQHATHNVGSEDSRRRGRDRGHEEDRRQGRRGDRDHDSNRQRNQGVNLVPAPGASRAAPVTPADANQRRRNRRNVVGEPSGDMPGARKAKRRGREDSRADESGRTQRSPAVVPNQPNQVLTKPTAKPTGKPKTKKSREEAEGEENDDQRKNRRRDKDRERQRR